MESSHNIPTMQFFTGISRNAHSKSSTECVWEFGNNALWDSHQHARLELVKLTFITWETAHILMPKQICSENIEFWECYFAPSIGQ